MLQIVQSDTKLSPIEINVRTVEGIADIYLNKNIKSGKIVDETGKTKTVYTAEQAYFIHTANDTLEQDINADFDKWFDFAATWTPGQDTDTRTDAEKIADLNETVDMLTECILEMSQEIYK